MTADPRIFFEKEEMKKSFSRIGFAMFLLIAVWYGFLTGVGIVIGVLEIFGYSLMPFYERYMLVFNELGLALGVVFSMLVLRPVPSHEIETKKLGIGKFTKYILIMFAIGAIGNVIGTMLLSIWNVLTNKNAGGEVEDILTGSDYALMTLMVGVIAPFLEEFFFRRLLIDRLRPYGEMTCIWTSALLFGLFHGNFTQFFYAAGLGALLAYIYFRSGSFLCVFLLHTVFNLLSGVLPAALMEVENELPYFLYLVIYLAVVLLGVLLFLMNIFSFKPQKQEVSVSGGKIASSLIFNFGMIVSILLMLVLMVFSLFVTQ